MAYRIEPFHFPSPVEDCECVICARTGVDKSLWVEPPSVFEMFSVQAATDTRRPSLAQQGLYATFADQPTQDELVDFDQRNMAKVDWITDADKRNLPWYKVCSTLLKALIKHRDARVFKDPVDWVKLNLADYPVHIKHPMDLGTIDRRLHGDPILYDNPDDFVSDVRMVFRNAYVFNPPSNPVWKMAATLSKQFEESLATYYGVF